LLAKTVAGIASKLAPILDPPTWRRGMIRVRPGTVEMQGDGGGFDLARTRHFTSYYAQF